MKKKGGSKRRKRGRREGTLGREAASEAPALPARSATHVPARAPAKSQPIAGPRERAVRGSVNGSARRRRRAGGRSSSRSRPSSPPGIDVLCKLLVAMLCRVVRRQVGVGLRAVPLVRVRQAEEPRPPTCRFRLTRRTRRPTTRSMAWQQRRALGRTTHDFPFGQRTYNVFNPNAAYASRSFRGFHGAVREWTEGMSRIGARPLRHRSE